MNDNAWLNSSQPLIIAHRGASSAMPENTLAAFALALDQGADGIELDVQLSKDGHLVLVHDTTLLRLTSNPRRVSELTVSELKAEDLGQGQAVALLEELFELLGDATLYNIELKDFAFRDQGLVDRVAETVTAFGLQTKTLISSFNPLAVHRARRLFAPETPVALLRAPGLWRYSCYLAAADADNPHFTLVDEAYMAWATRRGYHTFVWTVDDIVEARKCLALGVHGIITNDPAQMREQLALI